MSYVPLTTPDLLLAATLLVINAAISWGFQLKLEKSIAIAVVRMGSCSWLWSASFLSSFLCSPHQFGRPC